MKIAVTIERADTNSAIDPHFGRCAWFCIVDTTDNSRALTDNSGGAAASHGAGIQAVQTIAEKGVEILVTGQLGPKATNALKAAGIRAYAMTDGTVDDALTKLQNEQLKRIA